MKSLLKKILISLLFSISTQQVLCNKEASYVKLALRAESINKIEIDENASISYRQSCVEKWEQLLDNLSKNYAQAQAQAQAQPGRPRTEAWKNSKEKIEILEKEIRKKIEKEKRKISKDFSNYHKSLDTTQKNLIDEGILGIAEEVFSYDRDVLKCDTWTMNRVNCFEKDKWNRVNCFEKDKWNKEIGLQYFECDKAWRVWRNGEHTDDWEAFQSKVEDCKAMDKKILDNVINSLKGKSETIVKINNEARKIAKIRSEKYKTKFNNCKAKAEAFQGKLLPNVLEIHNNIQPFLNSIEVEVTDDVNKIHIADLYCKIKEEISFLEDIQSSCQNNDFEHVYNAINGDYFLSLTGIQGFDAAFKTKFLKAYEEYRGAKSTANRFEKLRLQKKLIYQADCIRSQNDRFMIIAEQKFSGFWKELSSIIQTNIDIRYANLDCCDNDYGLLMFQERYAKEQVEIQDPDITEELSKWESELNQVNKRMENDRAKYQIAIENLKGISMPSYTRLLEEYRRYGRNENYDLIAAEIESRRKEVLRQIKEAQLVANSIALRKEVLRQNRKELTNLEECRKVLFSVRWYDYLPFNKKGNKAREDYNTITEKIDELENTYKMVLKDAPNFSVSQTEAEKEEERVKAQEALIKENNIKNDQLSLREALKGAEIELELRKIEIQIETKKEIEYALNTLRDIDSSLKIEELKQEIKQNENGETQDGEILKLKLKLDLKQKLGLKQGQIISVQNRVSSIGGQELGLKILELELKLNKQFVNKLNKEITQLEQNNLEQINSLDLDQEIAQLEQITQLDQEITQLDQEITQLEQEQPDYDTLVKNLEELQKLNISSLVQSLTPPEILHKLKEFKNFFPKIDVNSSQRSSLPIGTKASRKEIQASKITAAIKKCLPSKVGGPCVLNRYGSNEIKDDSQNEEEMKAGEMTTNDLGLEVFLKCLPEVSPIEKVLELKLREASKKQVRELKQADESRSIAMKGYEREHEVRMEINNFNMADFNMTDFNVELCGLRAHEKFLLEEYPKSDLAVRWYDRIVSGFFDSSSDRLEYEKKVSEHKKHVEVKLKEVEAEKAKQKITIPEKDIINARQLKLIQAQQAQQAQQEPPEQEVRGISSQLVQINGLEQSLNSRIDKVAAKKKETEAEKKETEAEKKAIEEKKKAIEEKKEAVLAYALTNTGEVDNIDIFSFSELLKIHRKDKQVEKSFFTERIQQRRECLLSWMNSKEKAEAEAEVEKQVVEGKIYNYRAEWDFRRICKETLFGESGSWWRSDYYRLSRREREGYNTIIQEMEEIRKKHAKLLEGNGLSVIQEDEIFDNVRSKMVNREKEIELLKKAQTDLKLKKNGLSDDSIVQKKLEELAIEITLLKKDDVEEQLMIMSSTNMARPQNKSAEIATIIEEKAFGENFLINLMEKIDSNIRVFGSVKEILNGHKVILEEYPKSDLSVRWYDRIGSFLNFAESTYRLGLASQVLNQAETIGKIEHQMNEIEGRAIGARSYIANREKLQPAEISYLDYNLKGDSESLPSEQQQPLQHNGRTTIVPVKTIFILGLGIGVLYAYKYFFNEPSEADDYMTITDEADDYMTIIDEADDYMTDEGFNDYIADLNLPPAFLND